MSLDTMWEATFPERKRPKLYTSQSMNEDGFMPLSDPASFVSDGGIAGLTSSQLYALAANNADALVTAQQEWTSLEKLASQVKNRDLVSNPIKDPQSLPLPEIYEEIKESILYGYKYNGNRQMIPARFTVSENVTDQEKFDCREPPEPFGQAGLIPNDKQYRSVMALAKTERREHNPDNLQPYTDNFAFEPKSRGMWLPRMPPREEPPPYKTRTRAEGQRMGLAEGGESRQTRFNGERIPSTREASPLRLPGVGSNTPTGKRSGTPIGSPALKKRRLESDPEELSRRRYPNQNTRRGETEAFSTTNGSFANDAEGTRNRNTNQYIRRRDQEAYVPSNLASKQHGNHQQQLGSYNQRPGRPGNHAPDSNRMTKEEKRSHTFKDHELVEMIKRDHTWLNDDLALATSWRDRILNAEYPVRTWAMLRKWHEWKRENRHKRPRNKQKVHEEEASDAGVEDNAPKRPSRLRRQLATHTASPAPSSPLVNGISAQDITLEVHTATAKNLSTMDEVSTQEASPGPVHDPTSEDELQASQTSSATADEDDDYQDHTPTKAGTLSRPRPQIITRSSFTNGVLKAEKMARTRSSRSEQDHSVQHGSDGVISLAKRKPTNYVASEMAAPDAGNSGRRSIRAGRRGST